MSQQGGKVLSFNSGNSQDFILSEMQDFDAIIFSLITTCIFLCEHEMKEIFCYCAQDMKNSTELAIIVES